MIRTYFWGEEQLKAFLDYNIIKTESLVDKYGKDHTYATFGKGLTLGSGNEYIGDGDSVWYIRIWNPVKKQEERIYKGYDNMEQDKNDIFEVGATPEVLAAHTAWKEEQERIRVQKEKEYQEWVAKERAAYEAKQPSRGKFVKVVRGRKVPKGTIGKVFWYGQNRFGFSVGLELADDTRVFTAAHNVEVIKPEEVPVE